ncbi:MAG TPA: pseudouridine synthase [Anaerolineales bacterium]|nr:pseudouridine synthase [Anaerolineales bacterium]
MRTIVFNKPYGVLSQFTDEGTGHPTLKQFIDVPNVYAAGRLDRDSEGLLLLTDDGALVKRLADPKNHIEKTYLVMVEGDPTPEKLTRLSSGVQIKGHFTRPASFRLIPDPRLPERPKPVTPHGQTVWLEVKLKEGKKRQIRHMTATVGLFTLRIFRIAIGSLELGDLGVGKWRDLQAVERRSLEDIHPEVVENREHGRGI